MKSGARLLDQRIVLWGLANGRDYPRLGLTVGRKHGPAVRRNRLKRLIREAFRLTQAQLPPGIDLVCAPRVGGEASLAGYQESLTRLAARLARRLAQG